MDRGKSGQSPEEVVKRLRKTVSDLRNNLLISEHNMSSVMEKLKFDYGIDSIEEGIETVQRIDQELQQRDVQLEKITQEISVALENYSNG